MKELTSDCTALTDRTMTLILPCIDQELEKCGSSHGTGKTQFLSFLHMQQQNNTRDHPCQSPPALAYTIHEVVKIMPRTDEWFPCTMEHNPTGRMGQEKNSVVRGCNTQATSSCISSALPRAPQPLTTLTKAVKFILDSKVNTLLWLTAYSNLF